jgi:hypothetical protein
MEKKMMRYAGFFFTLTFISLLLIGGLLLCDVVFVAHTPSYITQAAASSDIDIRVQSLETGLESLQRDLVFQLNQKLYYFGGTALLISALAAFFGWRTFKDLDGLIQEKIRTTLENELYQLDPANLTIRLPKFHEDSKGIAERLKLSGLKKISLYPELNKACLYGLTLVPIETEEAEKEFLSFLQNKMPNPNNAAFVLYSTRDPREFRISPETTNKFPRAAISNMPATVITAILAVARGLHRETKLEDDKEEA